MKNYAYVLIFDGYADWEPALTLCEINKHPEIEVKTVGFSKKTICSMGGLKITPDVTLKEIKPENVLIFIMPGGKMWERTIPQDLLNLLIKLNDLEVLIAAICGATLALAKAGLLHKKWHTSNALQYLKTFAPDYRDDSYYQDKAAVACQNIVTASGIGSVDFAYEILQALAIYPENLGKQWYELFKYGTLPLTVKS